MSSGRRPRWHLGPDPARRQRARAPLSTEPPRPLPGSNPCLADSADRL